MSFIKLKPGDKFNSLTVISWDKSIKSWVCRCDCGNITNSRSWSLKNNKHIRCKSCYNKSERITRLPDNLGLKRDYYGQYKRSAAKREYSFDLTFEEFCEIILKNCAYCDAEPKAKKMTGNSYGKRYGFFSGIDRIDNNLGYKKDNCVPCCSICNKSKSTLSLEEWKSWINKVYSNLHGEEHA